MLLIGVEFGQVKMIQAVTTYFPTCGVHFQDLILVHISVCAHVIVDNIKYTSKAILLHNGEGSCVIIDMSIIEGDQHRARWKLGSFCDGLDELYGCNGCISPIMQQFDLLFKFFGRYVITAVDG